MVKNFVIVLINLVICPESSEIMTWLSPLLSQASSSLPMFGLMQTFLCDYIWSVMVLSYKFDNNSETVWIKGVSFLRNCGAVSVGEDNRAVEYYQLVESENWLP